MRDLDAPESPATVHSTNHAARWWDPEPGGKVHCYLCPRHCHIGPGQAGFCFVRANAGGNLVSLGYAHPAALQIDPIEKKPLNHFLPGTKVFSVGTAGCNMGCFFCQNWSISKSKSDQRHSTYMPPEEVVEMAIENDCPSIAFTYNEPTIWGEYVIDICKVAHAYGLKTVMVSNGYVTYEAFHDIYDHIDAANIDLKAFTEKFYGCTTLTHLQPVLDTLKWLKNETSVWFEITNLLIPTLNDAPAETRTLCEWILENLGPDVPLHFTAFHPDFKLRDKPRTPEETLHAARAIALEVGLHYVYEGNIRSGNENTTCPSCHSLLIRRNWHNVQENRLLLSEPLRQKSVNPRMIGSTQTRTNTQACGPNQVQPGKASVRFVGDIVPRGAVPSEHPCPGNSVTRGSKQDQPHFGANRLLPDPISSQNPHTEKTAPGHPTSREPQAHAAEARSHPTPNQNPSAPESMSPEPVPSEPEVIRANTPRHPASSQNQTVVKAQLHGLMLPDLRSNGEVTQHPPIPKPNQPEHASIQLTDARCPHCAANIPGRWSLTHIPPQRTTSHPQSVTTAIAK